MTARNADDHAITLRFLAEPTDVNFGGNVFGGSVMKWIDHAGYTCAANWSHSYCVTVYVGGIRFLRPIRVGDLVELKAEVRLGMKDDAGKCGFTAAVKVKTKATLTPRSRPRLKLRFLLTARGEG